MLPYVVDSVGVLWVSVGSGGDCVVCVVLLGIVFMLVYVVVVPDIGNLQPPLVLSTRVIPRASVLVDTIGCL